jgi:hypothetical protein
MAVNGAIYFFNLTMWNSIDVDMASVAFDSTMVRRLIEVLINRKILRLLAFLINGDKSLQFMA